MIFRYFQVRRDTNKIIDRILHFYFFLREYDDPIEKYTETLYYVCGEWGLSSIHRKPVMTITKSIVWEAKRQADAASRPITLRAVTYCAIVYILNSLYYSALTDKELKTIGRSVHDRVLPQY